MRNLLFFFFILVSYTVIYAGVSRFWHGVTFTKDNTPSTAGF